MRELCHTQRAQDRKQRARQPQDPAVRCAVLHVAVWRCVPHGSVPRRRMVAVMHNYIINYA